MRKEDKKEFLFDAMSDIDEKIIDSADKYPLAAARKRRFVRSAVSIAAAIAIIICAVPAAFWLNSGFISGDNNSSSPSLPEGGNGGLDGGLNGGAPTYGADDGWYTESESIAPMVTTMSASITMSPASTTASPGNGNSPVIKENPFVSTSKENAGVNISTFSADVDTASYCRFRNLVTGERYSYAEIKSIIGSSIRTEE